MGLSRPVAAKACEQCGAVSGMLAHHATRFCRTCASLRMEAFGGTLAHKAVQQAIRRGEIPPAKTLACVDCGEQARDYDHRDYAKKLEVQPVCRSCNKLRGPARPVLTFELPA